MLYYLPVEPLTLLEETPRPPPPLFADTARRSRLTDAKIRMVSYVTSLFFSWAQNYDRSFYKVYSALSSIMTHCPNLWLSLHCSRNTEFILYLYFSEERLTVRPFNENFSWVSTFRALRGQWGSKKGFRLETIL